ncbi:hypothetical protein [Lacibacter sediminis]|uniref:Uncharacterized protein n=1 Tax=Lacibacter sediminis TaxID=2760713 RepID=A0A7G5XI34_9BACT|nr:hypothetical protein [Lacibacter sediminis]QNA45137.1 hypothetical protein H4075_02760 [Lacibacter sediminis]
MKRYVFLLLFIGFRFLSFTQASKKYIIQPGESILEIIPQSEAFEYSKFEQGVVYFKDGKRSSAKINYNFVYEEMLFIAANGDTLTILNPGETSSVVIGKDEFYYTGVRFVKLDTAIGNVKLGVSSFFAVLSKKKVGAYGTTTEGGTDSYSSFIVPNNTKLTLTPSIVTTVTRRKALFIGNKFNQFIPVTKKNIFSFYPEKEEQLKKYYQRKDVNFSSRKDIIELIAYMGGS